MKTGIISKMYPLSKLIMALVIGFSQIIIHDWRFGYIIIMPLMFLLALIDGVFKSYAKKVLSVMLIFFSFIFLIQAFLVPAGDTIWQWRFLNLTEGGLLKALTLTSAIGVFLTALLLVFDTTNINDLMVSLQKTGMPNGATYVFLAALQMIPEMNKRSKIIMQAQRARGIETEGNLWIRTKAFLPTLSPLIISSITDIGDKAATLEARAFSSKIKNTYYRDLHPRTIDKVIPVIVSIICVALCVLAYLPGIGV